jgi:hypothetical protein
VSSGRAGGLRQRDQRLAMRRITVKNDRKVTRRSV